MTIAMQILASIVLTVLAHTSAKGSTLELSDAVMATVVATQNTVPSVAARKAVAGAMENYWVSFSRRIPRLSPPEALWVKGEVKSGDAGRMIAVYERREGALYSLLEVVEECVEAMRRVGKFAGIAFREEVIGWLDISRCLARDNGTLNSLKVAGLSDGKPNGEFYTVWSSFWNTWILEWAAPAALYNQ